MKTLGSFTVPIGVSARHVHLKTEHVHILFGGELHPDRPLNQKGEFAARERVAVVGPSASIHGVRVLGPPRAFSQLEISKTDAFLLGIDAPVRLSGNISGTPGVTLVGPRGTVRLEEGVILAARHLHITPDEANRYGLKTGMTVSAVMGRERRGTFHEIIVRVSPKAYTEIHLDTDEANAMNVGNGDSAEIIIPEEDVEIPAEKVYICAEDVLRCIRENKSIRLKEHQRLTPAAMELARSRGVLIE